MFKAIQENINELRDLTVNIRNNADELGLAVRNAAAEAFGDVTAGYLNTLNNAVRSATKVSENLNEGE